MHTVRTRSFQQYDHRELEIIADLKRVSKESVAQLIEHIQTSVAEGTELSEGTYIQYGVNLIKVTESDNDYLRLDEPSYKGLPISFKPGVTETLEAADRQLGFLESYGLKDEELNLPHMQQSGFVYKNYQSCPHMALSRLAPTDDNDSGWFIGSLEEAYDNDAPGNISRVSLYEILSHHKHVMPWLGFPNESVIILNENTIEVSLDGKPLSILEDSPLANARLK